MTKKPLLKIYELTCGDLTHLGGPMGTEYTATLFTRPFLTLQGAKDFAGDDNHKRGGGDIMWGKSDGTTWYSGDLRSHDYTISVKKVHP